MTNSEQNGVKEFDSLRVAWIFNSFYTSVVAELVSKLPSPLGFFHTTTDVFKSFYSWKLGLRPGFCLSSVSRHLVRKQLLKLNVKKAVGLDDVSSLFDSLETILEISDHEI